MIPVFDGDFPSAAQNRRPAGFDYEFIVAAVSGSRHDSVAVDLPQKGGTRDRLAGFHLEALVDNVGDRTVSVSDGRKPNAAEIDVLKVVRARFGIDAIGIRVLQAAILVGMREQCALIGALTI